MDSPAEAFTLAADRLSAAKARLEESEAAAAAASGPSAAARGEDETRAAFGEILAGLGSDMREDILAALSPELQRTLVDKAAARGRQDGDAGARSGFVDEGPQAEMRPVSREDLRAGFFAGPATQAAGADDTAHGATMPADWSGREPAFRQGVQKKLSFLAIHPLIYRF